MEYRACKRCIMDSTADAEIILNEDGICNHCVRYDLLIGQRVVQDEHRDRALSELVTRVQRSVKGDYDCIIGVSGGVDSTYVAYLVKQLGLNPLAVHFDNGWNSELAVKNIENVLRLLQIDLYTYVVNWNEFKDLQRSFLWASTPDGEIPTDHAINALLWREAGKRGIKYIISGMNFRTESISVPHWSYGHSDWAYIKDVHRRFGTVALKTYPRFRLEYLLYVNLLRGIRTVSLLNYVDYNKQEAMSVLTNKLGWKYYGGKHYESIYTRFYQGYLLPTKFGIDKRYGHLSDLINSGQIRREEALEEIRKRPYPNEDVLREDIEYVLKKLGITQTEFDQIIRAPIKSFRDYRNSFDRVQLLRRTVDRLRGKGLYPK